MYVALLGQRIKDFEATRDVSLVDNKEFYKYVNKICIPFLNRNYSDFSYEIKEEIVQNISFSLISRLLKNISLGIESLPAYLSSLVRNQANRYLSESYSDEDERIVELDILDCLERDEAVDNPRPINQTRYLETSETIVNSLNEIKLFLINDPFTKRRTASFCLLVYCMMVHSLDISRSHLDFREQCILNYLCSSVFSKVEYVLNL